MNNKKAFSLIELLVVVAIIGVLVSIAIASYSRYKDRSYKTWAISEMSHILSLAKMAKQTDGGYHQYLYQFGYRPKGVQYAAIGSLADPSANCCSSYPAIGTDPCSKTDSGTEFTISHQSMCPPGSLNSSGNFNSGVCASSSCTCKSSSKSTRYDYYSCKSNALGKAVNNIQICKNYTGNLGCNLDKLSSSYNNASYSLNGVTAQKSGSGNSCASVSSWCDCNSFYIAGESNLFGQKLSLDHTGQLCINSGSGTTYSKEEL